MPETPENRDAGGGRTGPSEAEVVGPEIDTLMRRLTDRSATVAVVGLGYVGLPLVAGLVEAGLRVLGYDIDPSKVERLMAGECYIRHLGADLAARLLATGRFEATSDGDRLGEADVVVLCVPTPLGPHREPDLRYVVESTELVSRTLRAGQLVVLESTTYPGTTRGVMGPILERAAAGRGLRISREVLVAYSPEREDPGSAGRSVRSVPKVVGGIDGADGPSVRAAELLYRAVAPEVVRVSSCEVAESSKLLENIYRAVNIALVNELKVVFEKMGVDIWEVIEAAKTKPFGFQAFEPGPGLGGHCIPIDPYYLTWRAREFGHQTRFIELAGEINRTMPGRVVERVSGALNDDGRPLRGARVLIVGIAYKKNVDDIRESPAAEIITELVARGAEVSYHDPHIAVFPSMRRYRIELTGVNLDAETLANADAVVIVTDHDVVDYGLIGEHARLVVDTRNAMGRAAVGGRVIRARVVKA